MAIPTIRHAHANDHPVREDGDYVLYWMIAFRRTRYNFALQHAVDRAKQFGKPLLIFEPLRARYQWASDRMHRFVIEGMRSNSEALAGKPVTYFPYVEPAPGVASPLLNELAKRACTVVTDDYPCFFLPRLIESVKHRIDARLELVDSNGVLPLRLPQRTFTVAHSYRRWMQKNILDALCAMPKANPLSRLKLPTLGPLPAKITKRWPVADLTRLLDGNGIESLPIDHRVPPSGQLVGGQQEAGKRLARFTSETMTVYGTDRNHPDEVATSGLSSHLHFGHISAHEVVQQILDCQGWTPDMAADANGKNHGFWNTSESAEGVFGPGSDLARNGLQSMTFREPASIRSSSRSLPDWAIKRRWNSTAPTRDLTLYTLAAVRTGRNA